MKKILGMLAFSVGILVAILLVRTLGFGVDGFTGARGASLTLPDDGGAERLAALLRFPTIAHDDRAQIDWTVFEAMHGHLAATYPRTHAAMRLEKINGHGLLFHWQGGDPELAPLVLMAHQDVVPVVAGTEADWEHPPFSGAIADGFIWGRGAMDDKASLAGILEATEWLLREGFSPSRSIYLAFGQDEEIGGDQGARAIAAWMKARKIRPAMVLDEGGLVADGLLPGVGVPVALVGVAEKGYLTVSLTARGTGGHSSMPPRRSAVGVLARAIQRLEASPFPADTRFAVSLFRHLSAEISFDKRLVFANDWLTKPLLVSVLGGAPSTDALIRTTTAATMFRGSEKENVLPIEAEAVVNFRLLPGATVASVLARIEAVIDDPEVTITVRGEAKAPSPVSPSEGPVWDLIAGAAVTAGGEERLAVAPFLVVGGTDARHFTEICDRVYRFLFLRMTEGDPERFHGTGERIAVADYEKMVRFYIHLIRGSEALRE